MSEKTFSETIATLLGVVLGVLIWALTAYLVVMPFGYYLTFGQAVSIGFVIVATIAVIRSLKQ